MTADFLLETIQRRQQWSNIFTVLKETNSTEYKSDFGNFSNNVKFRTIQQRNQTPCIMIFYLQAICQSYIYTLLSSEKRRNRPAVILHSRYQLSDAIIRNLISNTIIVSDLKWEQVHRAICSFLKPVSSRSPFMQRLSGKRSPQPFTLG